MPNIVATHRVGDMEAWLKGSVNRSRLFPEFCSSYRIFRNVEENSVSIIWENVDMEKMKALMQSPEGKAAKEMDTVLDPIQIFVEIDGGK